MHEGKTSHGKRQSATATKPRASWYAQGMSDGLGDRLLMFDNSDAPSLELLRFRAEFAQAPGFEAALRERVQRLDRFRHAAFAQVRSVQRLEPDDDLALISNCTPGKRLSEVLHNVSGPAHAAALIQQLAPALVLLQQHDPGISHGLLSPDRIVVSPEGRFTIVEHVVAPAIGALGLRAPQLASMGIVLPPARGRGVPRLDVAADWYQLGLVAVSMLIGRPVTGAEAPQVEALLDRLDESGSAVSPSMRQWLDRALQISGTRIESGADGRAALDDLLQKQQPRSSRRAESLRDQQAGPAAPSTIRGVPVDEPIVQVAAVTLPDVRHAVRSDRKAESPTRGPAVVSPIVVLPLRPPPAEPATVRPVRAVPPLGPPPAPVQPTGPGLGARGQTPHPGHQAQAPAEREPARPGIVRPPAHAPAAHERSSAEPLSGLGVEGSHASARPRRRTTARAKISTTVVAGLALIAAAEAGVLLGQAGTGWSTPQPAIVVESAASGENVVVSGGSAQPPPLRLTVAPDMRWIRVTTPSSAKPPGGTITGTTGTIQVSSPIELDVFEQSRILGSVPGPDFQVAPGRHEIELVNTALGYRLRQAIDVGAGQTVSIHVAPADGWVTIDATPWAEVSIDGRAAGRTPLVRLPLGPGDHDVAFRHPVFGTDRQRVTVRSDETVRVTGTLRH